MVDANYTLNQGRIERCLIVHDRECMNCFLFFVFFFFVPAFQLRIVKFSVGTELNDCGSIGLFPNPG